MGKEERRHYQNITPKDFIHIPKEFRRDYLSVENKSILVCPMSSFRIISKILNDVSYDQFRLENKKQKKQLSLFEQEFKTIDNTYARFTFNITDITKNDDYASVTKGLQFLEDFKRGWYYSTNAKGEQVKSYGGLIKNSIMSKGKITFVISAYWLEKLIILGEYNPVFYNLLFEFKNNKQFLLYLWLIEINDKGTSVSFEKIQKAFDYNYKTPYDFTRNVLKGLKTKLDKFSDKSFNYSTSGGVINIKPYYLKNVPKIEKATTNYKFAITQRVNYWKQRHELDNDNLIILRNVLRGDASALLLLNKAYSELVKKTRAEKGKKMKDLINDDFIKVFQLQIEETYSHSSWSNILKNGFPKLRK